MADDEPQEIDLPGMRMMLAQAFNNNIALCKRVALLEEQTVSLTQSNHINIGLCQHVALLEERVAHNARQWRWYTGLYWTSIALGIGIKLLQHYGVMPT